MNVLSQSRANIFLPFVFGPLSKNAQVCVCVWVHQSTRIIILILLFSSPTFPAHLLPPILFLLTPFPSFFSSFLYRTFPISSLIPSLTSLFFPHHPSFLPSPLIFSYLLFSAHPFLSSSPSGSLESDSGRSSSECVEDVHGDGPYSIRQMLQVQYSRV